MKIIDIIKVKMRNEVENKLRFHTITETHMFMEAITCYERKMFYAAATILACLYEKLFTTRLIRETSYPDNFIPSKENIQEQFDLDLKRTYEVKDGTNPNKKRGMRFKQITRALFDKTILSESQKDKYDTYYDNYRVPVLHGLDNRLYVEIFNAEPNITQSIEIKSKTIHKTLAEKFFEIINELHENKLIRKR